MRLVRVDRGAPAFVPVCTEMNVSGTRPSGRPRSCFSRNPTPTQKPIVSDASSSAASMRRSANFRSGRSTSNGAFIGHERAGASEVEEIAFVDEGSGVPAHYRLWVDAATRRIQRYVMMAFGRFMRGTYVEFDAAVEMRAP